MTPEVIIVGAGIIGCACAHELAAAGLRVGVFDVRRTGQGASQASAGVLAPFIEGHEHGPLRELGARSLGMYDRFVQDVMQHSGLTVQYSRNGTLEVAYRPESADLLRKSVDALGAEGVRAEWLEGPARRSAAPRGTPAASGGLLIADHGFVGVPDLVDALAASAMRNGATFALESQVIAIDHGPGGRIAVATENGVSFADAVVVATGSWTGELTIVETPSVEIKPVRGQLLHLSWTTTQPLRHVLWGPDCYVVPWLNGRVLVGATVEDAGFDERATAAGVRDLLAAGCALVPELQHATFAEVRVGLRPAATDNLPVIGPASGLPGVIFATGHYRNGVLLAPLTAALVKDLVLGEQRDPALAVLAPSRFDKPRES
jgi:glycine oxidase